MRYLYDMNNEVVGVLRHVVSGISSERILIMLVFNDRFTNIIDSSGDRLSCVQVQTGGTLIAMTKLNESEYSVGEQKNVQIRF